MFENTLDDFIENKIILFVLILFFLTFLFVFFKNRFGFGSSINEILGLSSKGSLQSDYQRYYNNKRRRKFY